jgi:hypothetical protein
MKPIPSLESKTVYVLVRFDPITANLVWNSPLTSPASLNNYYETRESAQNHQLLEKIKGNNWNLFELEIPIENKYG